MIKYRGNSTVAEVLYVPWESDEVWFVKQKIERFVGILSTEECWIWPGSLNKKGYGRIRIFGGAFLAHRVAYKAWIGELDPVLELDHLCRNHSCVNPWHLEQVTRQINALRGMGIPAHYAVRIRCRFGHEFVVKEGKRYRFCLECRRAGKRRRYRNGGLERQREYLRKKHG